MHDLKSMIKTEALPQHVAIIMDGNGRWAKARQQPRLFGHRNGVTAVREVSEAGAELGIRYLTLYAFSTENWNRPSFEVNALMALLVETIQKEISTLMKNDIRLRAIGDLNKLPVRTSNALRNAINETAQNTGMTLVLALNYSGRADIMQAFRQMHDDVTNGAIRMEDISEALLQQYLSTSGIPDPDFLIRTSGEFRISNFLLWEIAYSELYFTPVFWPDFRREDFYRAILDYQSRERRFGKIAEQLV